MQWEVFSKLAHQLFSQAGLFLPVNEKTDTIETPVTMKTSKSR